ncbi:hypothetical protein [Methylobacterium sp. E-045]|nr:hypothetical protein [Methylobacterium sp. E-045]
MLTKRLRKHGTGCKIAEMPDVVVRADNVVPTLDQSRVVIIE